LLSSPVSCLLSFPLQFLHLFRLSVFSFFQLPSLPFHQQQTSAPRLVFFVPLFLFINSQERGRLDVFYSVLFALLFIPKSYYYYPFNPEMTSSVILNPVIMIIMLICIAGEGVIGRAKRLISHKGA